MSRRLARRLDRVMATPPMCPVISITYGSESRASFVVSSRHLNSGGRVVPRAEALSAQGCRVVAVADQNGPTEVTWRQFLASYPARQELQA